MPTLPKLILLLTLIFAAANAYADATTEYQFDIIVFENLHSKKQYLADLSAHEFIRDNLTQHTKSERDVQTYQFDNAVLNYQQESSGELDEAYRKLSKSRQYKVLARRTWQQSGLSDGDTVTLNINPAKQTELVGNILPQTENNDGYISGEFNLTFSRYIHLRTNFTLHHDIQNTDNAAPYSNYKRSSRIQLERKMRSNETQYIDHPLLGILVNIKRLKKEKS